MVRFRASESEIAALLRFLGRRAPGGLYFVPLTARHRDELRLRRTPRPLVRRLAADDLALAWGLARRGEDPLPRTPRFHRDRQGRLQVIPEQEGMLRLQLGPACGPARVRDGLLEVSDAVAPDPADPARALVERAARRLRRRGRRDGLRWVVDPPAETS